MRPHREARLPTRDELKAALGVMLAGVVGFVLQGLAERAFASPTGFALQDRWKELGFAGIRICSRLA
eukprot:scaffold148683_cov20-Tisochrysis_lutea.AAC.1